MMRVPVREVRMTAFVDGCTESSFKEVGADGK